MLLASAGSFAAPNRSRITARMIRKCQPVRLANMLISFRWVGLSVPAGPPAPGSGKAVRVSGTARGRLRPSRRPRGARPRVRGSRARRRAGRRGGAGSARRRRAWSRSTRRRSSRRRRGRGSRRGAGRRTSGKRMRATTSPASASNQPGTGSSRVRDRDVGELEVAHPVEVEGAHRLAQVAPALQVPLPVGDVHLHRVDGARRGRGIRSLVGERHRDPLAERLGDGVAHLVDRAGRDDHLGRRAGRPAGELREQPGEEIGVADARDRAGELKARRAAPRPRAR